MFSHGTFDAARTIATFSFLCLHHHSVCILHMRQRSVSGAEAASISSMNSPPSAPMSDAQRVPQGLKHTAAEVAFATLQRPPRVCDVSRRTNKQLVGLEVTSQLMLSHLEMTGLPHVAAVLRRELKSFGLDDAYYVATQSPILFESLGKPLLPVSAESTIASSRSGKTKGSTDDSHHSAASNRDDDSAANGRVLSVLSPLVLLTCPHSLTRLCVRRLLDQSRDKLLRMCPGAANSTTLLRHLTAAMEQPMWSCPPADASLLIRNPSTSRILVATHNQLVEELTAVYINPVTSKSTAAQQMDDTFVKSLLAVHRSFMTSHALLAKLMQRYIVPSLVDVGEHYDRHGILCSVPPGLGPQFRAGSNGVYVSKRTSMWMRVQQLVRVRVLTVMSVWLRDFQHHFDDDMLEACFLFVEENCYSPQVHADAPAMIMQCAEFVRRYAADALASGVRGRSQPRHRGSEPPTLTGAQHNDGTENTGEVSTNRQLVSALSQTLSTYRAHAVAALGTSLLSKAASSEERISRQDPKGLSRVSRRQLLDNFRHLEVADVAMYLSGCSHVLFRALHTDALVDVVLSGSAAAASGGRVAADGPSFGRSSAGRDTALESFLVHAERLMHWAATLALCAGAEDAAVVSSSEEPAGMPRAGEQAGQTRTAAYVEDVFNRLLDVVSLLIERNDLHSAYGITSGLNHPAVARLHHTVFSGKFLFYERLEQLIHFFDLSNAEYTSYVASLPDATEALVPLLHVTAEELRFLDSTEPSFFGVHDTKLAPQQTQGSRDHGSSPARQTLCSTNAESLQWTASSIRVHWRKFQCVASLTHEVAQWQSRPIPHDIFKYMEKVAWALSTTPRGGSSSPQSRAGPAVAGASHADSAVQAAVHMEAQQLALHVLVTDPKELVRLSHTILPSHASTAAQKNGIETR